jgi:HD-GYP domain-containing protein (c-di-GMP phosphodiesterase class II)
MNSNMESLIAELKQEVAEPDLARLSDIYEKVIEKLILGFDPSVLLVLDNEDAHQTEIERLKFRIKEQIVARLMARANSVVMFGKIKSGDASSFAKVVLRMGMKTAKIYILALALFLLDPALEPLAAKSFSRAILGRILAEELGFKSTAVERVEMGSLLLEIGRIPAILYEIQESTSLDESFVSKWHPLLGLSLLRKYELPDYLEETLLHNHFSFLHRSLSPLAVIDLADLVVRQSFAKHGKLIVESPLPDATIDSTLGSNILDQFSAIGYRKFVEVRLPRKQ